MTSADGDSLPEESARSRRRRNPHRISVYEALCYTLLLLMAVAVAFGWFDLMIPWGS
jgi:cellulose synthase (UDP-forming)